WYRSHRCRSISRTTRSWTRSATGSSKALGRRVRGLESKPPSHIELPWTADAGSSALPYRFAHAIMTGRHTGIGMTSQRTRMRMVERLRAQGIQDERVLGVLAEVQRHIFVDEALAHRAY